MKTPISILLLCLAAILPASAVAVSNIVVKDIGLATPESVEYYADEDVYLVTNINGSPFDADDNGFISKISPDGEVIDLKWIDGSWAGTILHAPKGAAIVGDNLMVADRNQVHIFELPGGKQVNSVTIDGSSFLNGISPGSGDFVYVTDSGLNEGFTPSGTDAIYKVWTDGTVETVVKDPDMGHPNGIIEDGNMLLVVTFGSGKVYRVDANGRRLGMPSPDKGGLDGLLKLDDGRYVFSSWGGSAIYILDRDKSITAIDGSYDAPADLGLDTSRNRVLVPLFKRNMLVFIDLD